MKRRRVLVLDLTTRGRARRAFRRLMNANFASIMPQAVAAWCEELGQEVVYVCYTGQEDLLALTSVDADVAFIGSFTQSALTAYALSAIFRRSGTLTALGGPHARSYPQDAQRHFDYVLGLTDKEQIATVLADCEPHRPQGLLLSAAQQPASIPGVQARWKFIQATLAKAPTFKLVPMIASTGCPYSCNFCIDATIPYRPPDRQAIIADLRFLRRQLKRPMVGWHDPNFGVRFGECMEAIEEAGPSGSFRFLAETSLSLLSEQNVKRMARAGFVGMLPGIESWYGYDDKSGTRRLSGQEKVRQVAQHVNMLLAHFPLVQTNFIVGLDSDSGDEPFALTREFIDLAPGAYPTFSLFTSYGQGAPANLELQRAGRVVPLPFHFLDGNQATNVRPLHYSWDRFFDLEADLLAHAIAPRTLGRRFMANRGWAAGLFNLVRGRSLKRVDSHRRMAQLARTDASVRDFLDGQSRVLPEFYRAQIEESLGPLWSALPEDALMHDENAYLRATPRPAVGTPLSD